MEAQIPFKIHIVHLGGLSDADCWLLILKYASVAQEDKTCIAELVTKIFEKCGGVSSCSKTSRFHSIWKNFPKRMGRSITQQYMEIFTAKLRSQGYLDGDLLSVAFSIETVFIVLFHLC